LGNAKAVPFFDILLREIAKYGTLPMACPIKSGHYYMNGLNIDMAFPIQKNVPHMTQFSGSVEEEKILKFVLKYDVYFRIK
jgi:hypothetical protein